MVIKFYRIVMTKPLRMLNFVVHVAEEKERWMNIVHDLFKSVIIFY